MSDTRLPKMIHYSELASGARRPGGPLKRYKDCLRVSLNDCNIPLLKWEVLAADRNALRLQIHKGVAEVEERRRCRLDTKRQARKERITDPDSTVVCPECGCLCASRFGLNSHLRSQGRNSTEDFVDSDSLP